MDKFEQVKQRILELAHQKDFVAVKQQLNKIMEEYPDNAELLGMLAGLSIESGDYLQAEILVRQAIQADESYIFAYFLLARIKNNEEKYDEAIQELDKLTLNYGGRISKEMQSLINNLYGHIYKILGNPEQAANYYLSASHCTPHLWQKFENYSNYLFNLNYLTHINDSDLFKAHAQYNELFINATQYQHKVFQSHKKIRIGYISPDLRKHVVVYFVYQLMKRYNRELFEVYCYSLGNTDNISLQLKSFVDKWVDVSTVKNDKIAELIYQDEIDILVDFAGHTRNNPLPILAHKPAPIQVSGIGYFNTTGLKAIDYFITDIYVDPIGLNDEVFTEKLLRLPQTHFCYTPPATMVECSEPSYKKNGYITFGSFNNFTKVNDEVLFTWGKILARVSNSKLILKSAVFSNKTAKKEILKRIYLAGIKINQVELRSESQDYLSEYHDIDIALDPFPYPGGGTTCEALYMGVPVITLAGKRHGSRFGYSLLKNLDIEDCIAFSKEEYIKKAIDLANNFVRIDFLHRNLRIIMQKSPLMDGKTYLANIETAYEKIWLENKLMRLPTERGLLNNLAIEFTNKQEYFNLLACGEKILSLNENDCEGLHIKALAYMNMNRLALAQEVVVQIITVDEMYISAYIVLAHIYKRKGEVRNEIDVLNMIISLVESVEVEKRTVQYQNAYSEALSMLGTAQIMLGNAAKGGECFLLSSQAEQDFSQKLMEYSNFLLATHYTEEITKQNRFVMHKQYNDFFTNIKRIERVTTRKDRIRIGYISPDFRQHPVMDFSRALFTDFNHNKFEVFAYYTGTVDDTTEKIEETVTKFTFIHGKNDEEVAKLIANDEIDILVDLSGHTANSCLSILAYKPAPIQLCGLGYFNTTGLNSVDYFIGDQYCDNENTEEFFVEKIIRLPNSHFCYSPKQKFPEIKELPSMEKGYITFGSFNNFAKVNDEVLSIWCDILRNIPQSKIILKSKGFTFDDIRQATYKRFSKFGVEQNRIELRGFSTNYLEEYKEIDIALDPFPYTGGATTCEALYMGVPVLTLCGDTHGSRFGYSILKNIGLEDWIAYNKAEYGEKAIKFAKAGARLVEVRKVLRSMMEKSPLMDRKLYMKNIEKEYERIFIENTRMREFTAAKIADKMLDANKICFIVCLQHKNYLKDIMEYLNKLNIPQGYTVDVAIIENSKSIAGAYQSAMLESDARYKIYVDETITITNVNFLFEILNVFLANDKVGMIGVSGNTVIPANGILLSGTKRVGKIFNTKLQQSFSWGEVRSPFAEVQAIDGWIMATQVDVNWRDDLFIGKSGYDLAYNIDVQKKGYQCVVMKQEKPWCSIALANVNFSQRDVDIFLKEYAKDVFPLVSVLIPTYNRVEYLRVALESVLAQDYWNLEIIISDNADNDLAEQMLKSYIEKDERIKYFPHRNVGWGFAENWNFLMNYPSAEYINWLMDDDYFYPKKISTMMTYFLENENLSLVTSARDVVDAEGKLIETIKNSEYTHILAGREFGSQILTNQANYAGEPTTALIKKSCLADRKLGWRPQPKDKYNYSPIIDVETWLQLSSNGDVAYIAEPLSAFRNHQGQDQKNIEVIVSAWTDWYELIQYAYRQGMFLMNRESLNRAKHNWKVMAQKVVNEANRVKFIGEKKALLQKYLDDWK